MKTFYFSLVIILRVVITAAAAGEAATWHMAKPNCKNFTCGKISIPYPFGMGKDCYFNKSFNIECNKTSNPPKAFLTSIQMEVLSLLQPEIVTPVVKGPIFSSNCAGLKSGQPVNLTGSPFSFSTEYMFTAAGCNTRASMVEDDQSFSGCRVPCRSMINIDWQEMLPKFDVRTGDLAFTPLDCSQAGANCCQANLPEGLQIFNPVLEGRNQCKVAYLAPDIEFEFERVGYEGKQNYLDYVPLYLEWSIESRLLKQNEYMNTNCFGNDPYLSGFVCSCNKGYEGNPYLGCTDINECTNPKNHSCSWIKRCVNTDGSYKCVMDAKGIIITVVAGVCGVMALQFFIGWIYKQEKKRRKTTLKKKFYKQNGGILLQQQLMSIDSNARKTKIFTLDQLEKATDGFNENRVLGRGGQGTVYKGMLADGSIVAVKRSIKVDEPKLEEFANEVAILSQVNHRHVVQLLGCCLETEVPLLVYEFILNGSLFHYLQDENEEIKLSWQMRLRIAAEAAGAIGYLHTAASIPVYHRDIKSTNILLDEKFRAKVSDFGIARSISIDQTHLTTNVKGTFGYLDPDYFQSGQFTEKSDVYSFGVVLVELLSGQKPVCWSGTSGEPKGLAPEFKSFMEENKLFDMIDAGLKEHGDQEEIIAVAKLAMRCLNWTGRNRPTMREVAIKLQRIQYSSPSYVIEMNVPVEVTLRTAVSIKCDFDDGSPSPSVVRSLISNSDKYNVSEMINTLV